MFPKRVHIREVGPREGFQILKKVVPTEQKIQLIEALSLSGVSEIEVASFVRPDRVPQMADAEKLTQLLSKQEGVKYKGLYLNQKGYERAEQCQILENDSWLYTAASESFLQKNNNIGLKDFLAAIPDWIRLFKKYQKPLFGLMISTAFGSHEEGLVEEEQVADVVAQVFQVLTECQAVPQEISLADTVGLATPVSVRKLVRRIREEYPEVNISLHLHDTRGLAIACAYAGLEEGVTLFEGSVGGLGGCPFTEGAAGNIATEDLIYLCHRLGIKTGIDLEKYNDAVRLAEKIVGHALPGKVSKAKSLCLS